MSKGRRSPGPRHAPAPQHSGAEQTLDRDQGNAAHAEDLDGRYIPMDAAADGAAPVVESARLALELRYEGLTPMSRLIELLAASALPAESTQWLDKRLRNTADAEKRVDEALARWFGVGGDEGRRLAHQVLGDVADALTRGQPLDDGWKLGEQRFAVASATSIQGAADSLIAALAGEQGAAAVGLCRQLYLAVLFDDDDDEPIVEWGDL